MVFNLIHEKWIWVSRRNGEREKIAPWEITDDIKTNPILLLDSQRPDFNGSIIQFLIGLVQTTMSPRSKKQWRELFKNPPKPAELKELFNQSSHAFNLDGDNERFMQDLEEFEGKVEDVDVLLMEMPGETTIEKNTDHFLKRDSVKQMCFACSATALFNLQLNAPSGGRGHRTSLRGGGPLTMLVLGNTLWQTIWLNVILEEMFESLGNDNLTEISDYYPWMGDTRTSEKNGGVRTTPMDVNPKQMYWGMPRRIRLDFENLNGGNCDICGCESGKLIT